LIALVCLLVILRGAEATGQATLDGLVSGTYLALGAVGLALVFGVLRMVNFAHGDMLTFGAYIALFVNLTLRLPIEVAVAAAVLATAALCVGLERILWRPMRRRGAGHLQLLLVTIGLAYVIRNCIQLVAGGGPLALNVNVTSAISLFGGLRIGIVELVVLIGGVVVLAVTATFLHRSRIGKEMRALSDNLALSEVAGIDTRRVSMITWGVAGSLAGLAGVLAAANAGVVTPNFGFLLLLNLFAAMVLGGFGNYFGALAGGLLLGLVEEWSTLFINPTWTLAVGFAVLLVTLVLRPDGLLGRPALK
jgi:neutral amino acid transport system permease protein